MRSFIMRSKISPLWDVIGDSKRGDSEGETTYHGCGRLMLRTDVLGELEKCALSALETCRRELMLSLSLTIFFLRDWRPSRSVRQ